jgi:hypothetical protein
MTETRLWGETYPRDGIFKYIRDTTKPLALWDDRAHHQKMVKESGNVARFILENQPENLNKALLDLMVACMDWLYFRNYGFVTARKFIHEERLRQQAKWGVEQDHLNDRFACILWEEVGEVTEDLIDSNSSGIIDEIVQVAAVACCWLEFRLTSLPTDFIVDLPKTVSGSMTVKVDDPKAWEALDHFFAGAGE